MTTPISDFSNFTPHYPKEVEKEQIKKGFSKSSSRVILTKDSLEVPLEKQISAHSQETEPGHPQLPILQIHSSETHDKKDLSFYYYKMLRDELPALLKEKLNQDEALIDLADRNPDLIALDTSLKFEANLLALTTHFSSSEIQQSLLNDQQKLLLPTHIQQELLTYGSSILSFLEHNLNLKGHHDSNYEMLVNISNQIKEALELLKSNDGKDR